MKGVFFFVFVIVLLFVSPAFSGQSIPCSQSFSALPFP